jgi:hypothetical protein
MRKSNKCSYKIGINERKKRKFLRPEEAMKEADRLNNQPNLIKKFVAYKCTVCYFFHVGRSTENIDKKVNIFAQPVEEQEVIIEETIEDVLIQDPSLEEEISEDNGIVKKESVNNDHDNFDWESDKRIL